MTFIHAQELLLMEHTNTGVGIRGDG